MRRITCVGVGQRRKEIRMIRVIFQSDIVALYTAASYPSRDHGWITDRGTKRCGRYFMEFPRFLLRQTFRTSLKGVRFVVTRNIPEARDVPSSRHIEHRMCRRLHAIRWKIQWVLPRGKLPLNVSLRYSENNYPCWVLWWREFYGIDFSWNCSRNSPER